MPISEVCGQPVTVLGIGTADRVGDLLFVLVERADGEKERLLIDPAGAHLLHYGVEAYSRSFQASGSSGTPSSLGEKPSDASCLPLTRSSVAV